MLVGPHGRVVGLDISEGMIAIARERAAALGLGHAEFRVEDVTTAALPDAGFDAVLGRWSLIYLEDVAHVLERLRTALVPGGRIAITAWAPPEANPWFAVPQEAMARVRPVPAARSGQARRVPPLDRRRAGAGAGRGGVPDGRAGARRAVTAGAGRGGVLAHDDRHRRPAGVVHRRARDPRRLAQVAADVAARLERYRAGDVLRIPAQAQLAWGRA